MPLKKYQFFILDERNGKDFTYLDMQSANFLSEKEALLSQGFFVDGDMVLANSADDAVEKYQLNFTKELSGSKASRFQFYTFFLMLGSYLRRKDK